VSDKEKRLGVYSSVILCQTGGSPFGHHHVDGTGSLAVAALQTDPAGAQGFGNPGRRLRCLENRCCRVSPQERHGARGSLAEFGAEKCQFETT